MKMRDAEAKKGVLLSVQQLTLSNFRGQHVLAVQTDDSVWLLGLAENFSRVQGVGQLPWSLVAQMFIAMFFLRNIHDISKGMFF
jgi:hypothetical protein